MKLKHAQTRLARLADAKGIAEMSRELIEQGLPWTWRAPRVRWAIRDAETNCTITTLNGKLAAFAIAEFGPQTAHLNLLAVQPAYQHKGLGTYLVNWQELVAETAGIRLISLEVRKTNRPAIEFYSRLGYRETDLLKRYYCNREDALRMVHYL